MSVTPNDVRAGVRSVAGGGCEDDSREIDFAKQIQWQSSASSCTPHCRRFIDASHLTASPVMPRRTRRVWLGADARTCSSVHPLWFPSIGIGNARRPAQTSPDLLRLPPRTIVLRFSLTRIDQTVAVATGKQLPGTVKNRDAPTTGTDEATSAAFPVGAGRVVEANRLLDILPISSSPLRCRFERELRDQPPYDPGYWPRRGHPQSTCHPKLACPEIRTPAPSIRCACRVDVGVAD